MALLADGRLISYGTDANGVQTGRFVYDVWDPSAGGISNGHMLLPNQTGTDMFCNAQLLLPDGNMFLAGGDNWVDGATNNRGTSDTNLFNPATNSLTRGPSMFRPRWYATVTTMPNNDILIQGGKDGEDRPEVRSANGTFRLLNDIDTTNYSWWYPRNFVAPDGRIYGYDAYGYAYYLTLGGQGTMLPMGVPAPVAGISSSATMLTPGRILQCGGNSADCSTIDINGPRPVGLATGRLSSDRHWVNLTLLPDGKVLATGGGGSEFGGLEGTNNSTEIWNPATGNWTVGPAGVHPRLYHSVAMLLPDASVLISGGGAPGPVTNLNAEIYRPPYLFDNDSPARRPTIVSAPAVVNPGDDTLVRVGAGSDVAGAVLIKTGSVTHSFNFEQRRIPLAFTRSGDDLNLRIPSSGADVTPGFYMLFVLDSRGVPSVARILRVNDAPLSNIVAPWSAEAGGSAGNDYQLACNDKEVLVGVHGSFNNQFRSLGARCAAVDGSGSWSGNPTDRPRLLASNGGGNVDLTCPRDSAVVGIDARALSGAINRLTLNCRPLSGRLTVGAEISNTSAIGSTAGTAQANISCSNNRPSFGIFGRYAQNISSVGLLCRRDLDPGL